MIYVGFIRVRAVMVWSKAGLLSTDSSRKMKLAKSDEGDILVAIVADGY